MTRITITSLLLALCFFSCAKKADNAQPPPQSSTSGQNVSPTLRTVENLAGLEKEDTVIFHSRTGKSYRVRSRAASLEDTLPPEPAPGAPHLMAAAGKNKPCNGDQFDGSDRKAAKLSVATGQAEDFADLAGLVATLQSDQAMGDSHSPPISTKSNSARVSEEKRNVHVQAVWIYTFTREADEDYHVIIGSSDVRDQAQFMNMEVSGLPGSSANSFAALKKVRDDFESFFGLQGTCASGYAKDFIDNPVKVEVTGSLFFDKLHYDGKAAIGPAETRAKSYWEIHPITNLNFQ